MSNITEGIIVMCCFIALQVILISAALAVTFLGMICEDKYNTWKDDNE